MSTESLAASGQAPMLQEPVHVDVSEQWTRDATLRCPALIPLAAAHAPRSIGVPFLDRRPQPHLDEVQDVSIHNTSSHRLQ